MGRIKNKEQFLDALKSILDTIDNQWDDLLDDLPDGNQEKLTLDTRDNFSKEIAAMIENLEKH